MKAPAWMIAGVLVTATGALDLAAQEGTYLVLTAKDRQPPPFESVRITRGLTEARPAGAAHWLQFEVRQRSGNNEPALCALRLLTEGDPLAGPTNAIRLERYLLRIPETGEVIEYRDRHTGRALLPGWADFERQFLPRAAQGSGRQRGLPETCEFLGHVLTLQNARTNVSWEPWPEPRLLVLDRELLVGTSRAFKDSEGHRLPQQPQRQNYHYVPFTQEDYRLMIEAGVNLFTIEPSQEEWVRGEPVFYLRQAGGKPPLRYPADLYRANYLGPVMFMDEPSILMVGDTNIHRTLRYFSDAAALITKRTREVYDSEGGYGAGRLEKSLLDRKLNLGDLRLRHYDLPSWETLYETAFYQMRGGGMGIVHEGRYQLAEFDKAVERFTGQKRAHTGQELLQYYYAFLRGGTRPFHKFWGTAIYGQCDTNLAPAALTMAYDMGARYLWFWTSDHDHHVPWVEQMELVRALRAHERAHPRLSIFANSPKVDVEIVIPDGYFLSLENLWWVRVLDKEGKNDASIKYRRLMQRALAAVHECFARNESFDITVDDGREITGYSRVVRLNDAGPE
jgi:hypothetical protein